MVKIGLVFVGSAIELEVIGMPNFLFKPRLKHLMKFVLCRTYFCHSPRKKAAVYCNQIMPLNLQKIVNHIFFSAKILVDAGCPTAGNWSILLGVEI